MGVLKVINSKELYKKKCSFIFFGPKEIGIAPFLQSFLIVCTERLVSLVLCKNSERKTHFLIDSVL